MYFANVGDRKREKEDWWEGKKHEMEGRNNCYLKLQCIVYQSEREHWSGLSGRAFVFLLSSYKRL